MGGGDEEAIKKQIANLSTLIESSVNFKLASMVGKYDVDGRSILYLACRYGHPYLVSKILETLEL